jgi:hypothetical protein
VYLFIAIGLALIEDIFIVHNKKNDDVNIFEITTFIQKLGMLATI